MEPTRPIEVDGIMTIIINPTSIKVPHPSKLSYHHGLVKSGSRLDELKGCRSTVFEMEKESAEEIYILLTQFAHPCVMKTLGHVNRIEEDDSIHAYLALEFFESTFALYTRKHGPAIDQNGRFTEEFIALMSDVVHGMEELHSKDHCCPILKNDDIAVMRKGDLASAKIWKFERCVAGMEDKQKDGDWIRLGGVMMFEVGWSDESWDLVVQMSHGKLKGRSILKHSALLTVRQKFQNVLELNFHISVYYPKESNQDKSEDESKNELDVSELCAGNLNTCLDKKLVWNTPGWMNAPDTNQTLRGFVKQLRIVFEHEVKHIPPKLSKEDIIQLKKEKDLDHHLQASCGNIIRALHMLVNELKLNN